MPATEAGAIRKPWFLLIIFIAFRNFFFWRLWKSVRNLSTLTDWPLMAHVSWCGSCWRWLTSLRGDFRTSLTIFVQADEEACQHHVIFSGMFWFFLHWQTDKYHFCIYYRMGYVWIFSRWIGVASFIHSFARLEWSLVSHLGNWLAPVCMYYNNKGAMETISLGNLWACSNLEG